MAVFCTHTSCQTSANAVYTLRTRAARLARMERKLRWFVVVLAWIGGIAIFGAVVFGALYLGARYIIARQCRDTEQQVLTSPNGARRVKAFHQECGANSAYLVSLSTGMKQPEYVSIADFDDVGPGQVSVHWNGSNEVDITYPRSAKVQDAYAKILGVRVVLNPPL